MKVLPAIVIVPVRDVFAVFAATEYVTVPLPDPLAPPVTAIQFALLVAVHVQPADAVTPTEKVPAGELTVALDRESVYEQVGAPACVTVNA